MYTSTLTGLGDRAHLFRPDINLETHIQDVVALLEMEDLRDVMLVGHSYAGFIISGVADRARQRIDLGSHRVPDATTLMNFRHLLERSGLGAALFALVGQLLMAQGLKLAGGTIVGWSYFRCGLIRLLRKSVEKSITCRKESIG